MTMIATDTGWLISEAEAEQLTQEELERILLRSAWAELQAVSSYVERYQGNKHDKEQAN